jgi:hypothetical protein
MGDVIKTAGITELIINACFFGTRPVHGVYLCVVGYGKRPLKDLSTNSRPLHKFNSLSI